MECVSTWILEVSVSSCIKFFKILCRSFLLPVAVKRFRVEVVLVHICYLFISIIMQ